MQRKGTKILKTSKAWPVYELAHAAWRARAIDDFSYGARGPDDATVVWTVNGVEYAKTDHDAVRAVVRAALAAQCIAAVTFGDAWMGYRDLLITFTDGVTVRQGWDGTRMVVEEVAA